MQKKNQTEVLNDERGCSDYLSTREQIKQDLEAKVFDLAIHFKQFCVDEGYVEYAEMPLDYFIELIRCQKGIDDEETITKLQENMEVLFYPPISINLEDS